ncbi:MAG: thiol peroxidase [Desulfuromonadaceae bacterium]|nr:thiol peroxidase [Desulfuromonadaceae bacterium]
MAEKRTGIITFKKKPMTLLGPDIDVGSKAPDFKVVDTDLKPVTRDSAKGKIQLITVVPSIDTDVCDIMTRRFNQDVSVLPRDVVVYAISMDLPFAQKRWCVRNDVARMQLLSDYQDRSFGFNYGLMIDELKLLARAVYVIDANGTVAYREIVPEVTDEPNYPGALNAVKGLL